MITAVLHLFSVEAAVGAVALVAEIPSWVAWPLGSLTEVAFDHTEEPSPTGMALRWVLFDLNGTLLDPGGIGEPLGWSRQQSEGALQEAILLSMAETLSGGYRPLPDLLRAVLVRRCGVADEHVESAMERASRMPAFPGAAAAVDTLREAGLRTGVLTNSGTESAERALEAVGLRDRMELVVGSDQVKAFKPDPRIYARGLEAARVQPREGCLLAAHAWDLLGAARVGMRTAWVAHKEERLLAILPAPPVRGESLEQVAVELARLASKRGP